MEIKKITYVSTFLMQFFVIKRIPLLPNFKILKINFLFLKLDNGYFQNISSGVFVFQKSSTYSPHQTGWFKLKPYAYMYYRDRQ